MQSFIGIDASKNKVDLSWIRDQQTGKKKNKVFKNTPAQHQTLLKWIVKNTQVEPTDVIITIEPTGVYHESLTYFLYEKGFNIFMANPGKAKKYADAVGFVHKTDKSDAAMLAFYGASQASELKLWQPEAQEIRELKAMMRRLEALEKDLQREQNRQEAADISGASERVRQSLQGMIRALTAEIEKLKQDIDNHIDQNPDLKKSRALLESIQGIGAVMSRELVYLFAAKRFRNARQVAAYLGLIPKLNESGKLKGRTTLSKVGPSSLRAKLYMAAVVASQHNPDIRAQKQRLLLKGKTALEALGAAMRKLVQICFGVVKHQSEYRPQLGAKSC